jgi:hypothetical protein
MPLPTFKTLDEIPEAFRPEYEEVEGEWRPKAESELSTERKKRAQLLDEKREADRLAKEARERAEKAEREVQAREHKIPADKLEELRAQDEQKRKAELEPIQRENEELKKENRKLKHVDKVQRLALAAGVKEDRIDDAMMHLDRRTDLADDGKTIVVKDKDGNLTTQKVEDFLATTFRTEKPWLYEGPGASGSDFGRAADPIPVPTNQPTRTDEHLARAAAAF